MSSIAGKKSRIKVATSQAGPYTAVAGVKSFTHSIDGTNVDDSEMGVDYAQRIQGLKDGKLSIAGGRRVADAGQNIIRDALLNGTDLWVHVLPDNGTTAGAGFEQLMLVSKFGQDSSVEDKLNLSIELEGSGAIAAV